MWDLVAKLVGLLPNWLKQGAELAKARKEIQALSEHNRQLLERLNAAEARIGELERKGSRDRARLHPAADEILYLLAAAGSVAEDDIIENVSGDPQLVRYHLDELHLREFVQLTGNDLGQLYFGLAHAGRAYMVRHGMLS